MEEPLVALVYDTLTDVLTEEYRLPGVENLFAPGKPCDILYKNVYEAQLRICERYHVDSDADVESIIGDLTDICREVGYKMFEYGAKYSAGKQE